MRRMTAILLTLVMLLALVTPAAAEDSATASTMRLMETEGSAHVKNFIGWELTLRDNMRLYNGYTVSTEAASYAYISLDNSKAVKLDASSAAGVSKSGKQLELKVTAGEMMFNVPVALEDGESLEIRTSNSVTGIRGTAGWVKVLNRYTTRVSLLEGAATIYSVDPDTGEERSVTITGGQTATIILHERARQIAQELIAQGVIIEENIVEELTEVGQVVEELREEAVPGFVAAEVAGDAGLQQRITESTALDVSLIIYNYARRLADEEAEAAQQDAAIQQIFSGLAAQELEDGETVFPEPEIITVTERVVETVRVVDRETELVNLDGPTTQQVQEALDQFDVVAVTNAGDGLELWELTVAENQTLYIIGGAPAGLPPGGTWTVTGTVNLLEGAALDNAGTIDVVGTLDVGPGATLNNAGDIYVRSTDSLNVGGALNNESWIYVGYAEDEDGTYYSGKLLIEETGLLDNRNSGHIAVLGDGVSSLENQGTLNITGNEDGDYDSSIDDSSIYVEGLDSVAVAAVENNGGTLNLNGWIAAKSENGPAMGVLFTGGELNISDGGTISCDVEDGADDTDSYALCMEIEEDSRISFAGGNLKATAPEYLMKWSQEHCVVTLYREYEDMDRFTSDVTGRLQGQEDEYWSGSYEIAGLDNNYTIFYIEEIEEAGSIFWMQLEGPPPA